MITLERERSTLIRERILVRWRLLTPCLLPVVAKDPYVGVDQPLLEWDDVALHYTHQSLSVAAAAGLEIDKNDTQEVKTTAQRCSSFMIDWRKGVSFVG